MPKDVLDELKELKEYARMNLFCLCPLEGVLLHRLQAIINQSLVLTTLLPSGK